jgi:hypothetical protein
MLQTRWSKIRRATPMSTIGDVDAPSSRCVASGSVTLLDALYAFYQEHERCGELHSDLDDDRVWMGRSACAAAIDRCADDD